MNRNNFFISFLILLIFSLPALVYANNKTDSIQYKLELFNRYSEAQLKLKLYRGSEFDKIAAGYLLGKMQYNKKQYAQSFSSFNLILESHPKTISREFRYKLKANCGLSLCKNKQFDQSLKYYKSAGIYLAKEEKAEHALLANDIANTFFDWGKYDSASFYFQKAEVLLMESKNEKPLAGIYNSLGKIAHTYHLSEAALSYYLKSNRIATKYGLKTDIANSLLNLGIEHSNQNNDEQAAKYLSEALDYAISIHYKPCEISALYEIAVLFAKKNNYSTAFEYLKKSDSIAEKSGDIELKIIVLYNMATLYKLNNQFDQSMDTFNKILEIQQSENLNPANTELSLGEIYKLQNNIEKAIEFVEKSRDNFLINRNIAGLYNADFIKAEIDIKLGKIEKAEQTLLNLLGEIKNEKVNIFDETILGIYLRLSNLAVARSDNASALLYYKEYEKLKSDKLAKAYNFNLAKIENESKMYQLKAKIDLLDAQNKTKTLEIDYQRRKSFALIFISILLLGFSFYLLKLYTYKNKLYTELVKRNIELAKSLPFQEEKVIINEITETEFAKSKEIVNKLILLFENEQIYLKKDINLIEVADRLDTNRTYLSKAIREILDTNFSLLINKYRIEKARKLLADPFQKLSIEGIAYQVGFNSKSTFNVAFKNHTGLTPSELRAEVLKNS